MGGGVQKHAIASSCHKYDEIKLSVTCEGRETVKYTRDLQLPKRINKVQEVWTESRTE